MKLVLASASPRRLELLQKIGIPVFKVQAANLDETPISKELPHVYCQRIAKAKAECVHNLYPECLILAADSTVTMGRRIIGKPKDQQTAEQYFRLMSGRRHQVLTAICLINRSKVITKVVKTHVQFQILNNKDINLLLDNNEWQDKCGGYSIEGIASIFIKQIRGTHTNVMGLPVHEVHKLLRNINLDYSNE